MGNGLHIGQFSESPFISSAQWAWCSSGWDWRHRNWGQVSKEYIRTVDEHPVADLTVVI